MTATDELTAARLRLTLAVLTTAGESHQGLRDDAAWLKLWQIPPSHSTVLKRKIRQPRLNWCGNWRRRRIFKTERKIK
jgi:hypothetical protein